MVLIALVALAIVLWLGASVSLRWVKANDSELQNLSGPLSDVSWEVDFSFVVMSADTRMEVYRGNNLDIYLPRTAFESLPYPDREHFVETVGAVWCKAVDRTYLPSVKFRDLQSGDRLGSYNCLLSWSSVNP
jgi:hypothetical protein